MAYLATDSTKNAAPKGAAGVAWWKTALSAGGDIFNALFPQIKAWLGTADKNSANDLLTWIQTNTTATSKQFAELQQTASTQMWVMIGVLGVAVLGGFYFLNKKGSSAPAVKVPVKV
jgi:hypothetical protein